MEARSLRSGGPEVEWPEDFRSEIGREFQEKKWPGTFAPERPPSHQERLHGMARASGPSGAYGLQERDRSRLTIWEKKD